MEKITDNIYTGFKFRGCNSSFVVTDEGVVMIDTPMIPSEAKQWREEVEKFGQLKYLISNEPHSDHVGGNCWFGGTSVAHEGTLTGIKENLLQMLESQLSWMVPDALPLPKDFHIRLPDITFSHNLTLYLGKHSFHLMHVPGHTPSETAVYVPEERTVFVSDNVIGGMPIMISAVPYEWLKSLKKLQTLDVDRVIPGHGPVFNKSAFQKTHDNVSYFIDQVSTAMAKGWDLKEIQEKVTMFERFPPMGKGDMMKMIRHESIEGLYNALKKG